MECTHGGVYTQWSVQTVKCTHDETYTWRGYTHEGTYTQKDIHKEGYRKKK